MCNAKHHSTGCTCGWGGEGHLGRPQVHSANTCRRLDWQHGGQDFTRPTKCPRCRGAVFYVRHNGGGVWLDELGSPWPKHACFDDGPVEEQFRQSLASIPNSPVFKNFGVIISVIPTRDGGGAWLKIRRADGSWIEQIHRPVRRCDTLLGKLVVLTKYPDGDTIVTFPYQMQRNAHNQLSWQFHKLKQDVARCETALREARGVLQMRKCDSAHRQAVIALAYYLSIAAPPADISAFFAKTSVASRI